ncbi:hypothetical protein Tco_0618154 [Tanacetum coccineum]
MFVEGLGSSDAREVRRRKVEYRGRCKKVARKAARWPDMDKWRELGRVIQVVHERQAAIGSRMHMAGSGLAAVVGLALVVAAGTGPPAVGPDRK